MVNTNELMTACFEAETKEEMWICRNLENSIAEKSPYAWKLYYSGEAKANLSQKSLKALETVIKRVEKFDERFRSKRKLDFEGEKVRGSGSSSKKKKTRVRRVRSRPKGVKIEAEGDVDDSSKKDGKGRALKPPREKKVEGVLRSCDRRRSVRISQKKLTFEDELLEKKQSLGVGKKNEHAEEKRMIVCALPAQTESVAQKQREKKKGKMVATEFNDEVDECGRKTTRVVVDGEVVGELFNDNEHPVKLQSVKEEAVAYSDNCPDDDVLILSDVNKEEDDEETYEMFVEGDDGSIKQFHVSTMNDTTYLSYLPNMPVSPTVASDDVDPTSHDGTH